MSEPKLTYEVDLPGGQTRLREAALYVMEKCKDADWFGVTKLNKMLWRADFRAFADRRVPVTGRQYVRLQYGPAPFEMSGVLSDLIRQGYVEIGVKQIVLYSERRPRAVVGANTRFFSKDDLSYLDSAVEFYYDSTATRVSKHSHGVAWGSREDGDPMPYELSLLSDDKLSPAEAKIFLKLGEERGWRTH